MSIQISLNAIVIALVVAGMATLGWWLSLDVLHCPAWVCLWVFGFILLALSISIKQA